MALGTILLWYDGSDAVDAMLRLACEAVDVLVGTWIDPPNTRRAAPERQPDFGDSLAPR
jgi:hypothetical protein